MGGVTFSIAAADAVLGKDIFSVGAGIAAKQAQQGNGVPRKLQKIGVTGSTNAGDFAFDLYAGTKYIGTYMNTTGGANVIPKENQDIVTIPAEDIIPANVTLIGMITDAAAANPVFVTLYWEDRPVMGGSFRSDTLYTRGGGGGGRRSYGGGYRRPSSGGRSRRSSRRRSY